MIKRALSWLVLALVVYLGYVAAVAFRSPWGSFTGAKSPVISALPAAALGCGSECAK